jgi:hypothetical protein
MAMTMATRNRALSLGQGIGLFPLVLINAGREI